MVEALRGHFEPRGRGVDRRGRLGWSFTGRTRALQELVEWLTDADADLLPRPGGRGASRDVRRQPDSAHADFRSRSGAGRCYVAASPVEYTAGKASGREQPVEPARVTAEEEPLGGDPWRWPVAAAAGLQCHATGT
ncbi:MAG: hypothetical protein ACRDZO_27800 [Egibacteraceae bacterium]